MIHNRARPLRSPSTTSLSEKVDERTLNNLGYTLLYSGETQDAITVFKRNVQEYPQSSNVSDSLGESYMKAGQGISHRKL